MTHDISYLFRYHEVTDRIHKSGKSSISFHGRLHARRIIKISAKGQHWRRIGI